MRGPLSTRALAWAVLLLATPACSVRKMAVNSLGNALAEGGTSYAQRRRPRPRAGGRALRPQDGRGPARRGAPPQGPALRRRQRLHAVRLRLHPAGRGLRRGPGPRPRHRAARPGPQALPARARVRLARPGGRLPRPAGPRCARTPRPPSRRCGKKDVPLLFWTANAWGAAIALSKDDSELTADQNLAEALMRRALALDEGYERGSVHDFFISYEGGRRVRGRLRGRGPAAPGAGPGPVRRPPRVAAASTSRRRSPWGRRTARSSSASCAGPWPSIPTRSPRCAWRTWSPRSGRAGCSGRADELFVE